MDLRDLPKSLQNDHRGYGNCAEVNGAISYEVAWDLREKYLRMERPAPVETNIIHQAPGI